MATLLSGSSYCCVYKTFEKFRCNCMITNYSKKAQSMSNTIAIIFDFDITLSPYFQQEVIFKRWGIKAEDFWKESTEFMKRGYDMEHAYLRNLIDYNKRSKKFALNNTLLKELGSQIDLYEGLSKKENNHSVFDDLERIAKTNSTDDIDIKLEYYCISGGIKEMIEGALQAHKLDFKEIFACSLDEDASGTLGYIKETVGHTIKTQKLYMIAKGVSPQKGDDPSKVNEKMEKLRIPFENMIFLGDGQTDIPAFSMLKSNGGRTIAVYREEKKADGTIDEEKTLNSYKNGYELAIKAGRAEQLLPADYSDGKPLKMALLGYVQDIAQRIAKG